ncbi:MAG: NAD(P)/FAD-dependent oxidoreductase, partial [Alphaproteobacteria bacterium]|nr:NAD(P)/FAD-dependent oxidoreductase [Alphaproteobacteria bacterium]
MEAYDAAVIGAGVEGLAGATLLARGGLRTIVIERSLAPGGHCQTIEFHPGYFASAFADDIAPVPRQLAWSLDLSPRGALLWSAARSTAVWPGHVHSFSTRGEHDPFARLWREAGLRREEALVRALSEPERARWWRVPRHRPWPAEDWARAPLVRIAGEFVRDEDGLAHALASAACGRAVDPSLNGSALNLLLPRPGSATPRGGVGGLVRVLSQVAREAGATISCGLDATEIRLRRGRVAGVVLSDGTELKASAVLSTLDLKRTFLSLFKWPDLPPATGQRVTLFRPAAATARLLMALDGLPALPRGVDPRAPLFIAPDPAETGRAFASWKAGRLPAAPPVVLRLVSQIDPFLAPRGKATATATVGSVPYRFSEDGWSPSR